MDTEQGPLTDVARAVEPSALDVVKLKMVLPKRYRLLSAIASGGFGTVVRAYDEVLQRTVAMKILHWQVAADDQLRARFLMETEITAQLQHPGMSPSSTVASCPMAAPGTLWKRYAASPWSKRWKR